MNTTTLSNVLDAMNAYQDISTMAEEFKIRQLDYAIRKLRRQSTFPWNLIKGSLKVFDGVKEYPIVSGHDELAFLEKDNIERYADSARFFNTDLKQFYQDVNSSRNLITEIWDGGTKLLGVNYKESSLGSKLLSNASVASEYTGSGDAGTPTKDTVTYKIGGSSISVPITSSAGTATIVNTITSFSDSKYKNKYHFRWIYLDAVPTSINIQLRTDASNYLSTDVTTQFSGQAFKADQWNLIAQDLNTATETGTFDSTDIASEAVVLTGAGTGTYYLDDSNLREWTLLDYWYYSKYNIQTEDETSVADQEYFYTTAGEYNVADKLIGDSEWIDVIMYDAMKRLVADIDNKNLYAAIMDERRVAWDDFFKKYPNLIPQMTSINYRFNNDPLTSGLSGDIYDKKNR